MKVSKKLIALMLAVMVLLNITVISASAANTEASIIASGIIGGVPKTVETDPLTTAVNMGDYWYYDTDYPDYYDDSVQWTLDSNGVLTIFGNGGTAQFGKGSEEPANISSNCPFYKNESIKTAVIESGVTYVSAWTFEQIPNLTTIIVMDAGTRLDHSWVRDCPNIETILYGASLNNNTSDLRILMAYPEKTLVLSKNLVQSNPTDFILRDDCNIINYGLTAKNNTVISYSEMLARAKAALADVPDYVIAKLPAELSGGASGATVTVTFSPNGGTVGTAGKTVTVGMPYGTLPVPTRAGCTFDGWYTDPSGGQPVTDATPVSAASDHTLYAHWTAAEDTFRFSNSASNFNSTYQISENAFSFLTEGESAAGAAYLRSFANKAWQGSCYGMSTVYALARGGELDVSAFQSGASLLYDLNTPRTSASVNDLINFYHLSQCDSYAGSLRFSAMRYSVPGQEEENLRTLIQRLDSSGGYLVLGVSYMSGPTTRADGHAVVAVDYTRNSDGGYAVRIWDPNDPDTFNTLTIASDFSGYSFASPLTSLDTFITYALLPDEYNHKDLESYAVYSGEGDRTVSGYSTLVISDTGFRVDCSDGSYAVFENGVQTAGDLTLTDISPETDGGSGVKSYAFPASADAVITVTPATADRQEIALLTGDTYAAVEASDIRTLTFSEDSVSTDCAAAARQQIVLASDTLGDTWNSATLTGADTGFSLKATDGTVQISSDNSVAAAVTGSNAYTGKASVKQQVESTRSGVALAVADMPAAAAFNDVPAGAYYYDAVEWAVENGITKGTAETTFSPDDSCTRAQIVTFLWRAAGSPAPRNGENPFTDVNADTYYYDAVLWAVENGITTGITATLFCPDAVCTRAQAVTFLWRAQAPAAAGTENPFTDVDTGAYYAKAVSWAVENGVTIGTSATTFSPDLTCTRGQIVTFLYRALADG